MLVPDQEEVQEYLEFLETQHPENEEPKMMSVKEFAKNFSIEKQAFAVALQAEIAAYIALGYDISEEQFELLKVIFNERYIHRFNICLHTDFTVNFPIIRTNNDIYSFNLCPVQKCN
jgi:hypothetical protein